MPLLTVVALSLGAALAFAASSALKHASAGSVPDAQDLRPGKLARFVRASVTHRLWLAGMACDLIALVMQMFALHLGALAVVQPLLITGLLFALLLRRDRTGRHVSRAQLGWAAVLTAVLAAFVALVATSSPAGARDVDHLSAVFAAATGVVLAAGCIGLGRRRSPHGSAAALLGAAVGLIYAANAAVLKAITDILARDPLHVLISWQLYAAVLLGLAGLLLNQLAFQAGPLAASLPATATIDPLASIAIGVAVFDEPISHMPAANALLVVLLVLLGVSVIQLARNPAPALDPRAELERPARDR